MYQLNGVIISNFIYKNIFLKILFWRARINIRTIKNKDN